MFRCIALAVLVGVGIVQGAEPPAPNPKDPVDYVGWMNAEFKKEITDNAADLYQEAVAALVNDEELAKLAGTPARDWTAEQREKVQAWVDRNREALDKFTAASEKQGCFFELHSPGGSIMQVTLPELSQIRTLARVLSIRGQLRLAAGDVNGAVQDGVALCRVGRHLEYQPFLISYLTGMAVRSLACSLLIEVPRAAGKEVDYPAILSSVEKGVLAPRNPAGQIQMEKIMVWDSVQRFLRDADGDGRFERLEMPDVGEPLPNGGVLKPAETLDEIMRKIDDYYGGLEKAASMDYPQARAAVAKLEELLADAKGSFLGTFAPSLSRVFTMQARATAQRRGTLLILRMHAYRAENGKWPSDLNAILPKDEPSLGTDPFSGQPFVYRLEKDEPHLYSVSENGKDDGGEVFRKEGKPAWGATGDYVFWPPATK